MAIRNFIYLYLLIFSPLFSHFSLFSIPFLFFFILSFAFLFSSSSSLLFIEVNQFANHLWLSSRYRRLQRSLSRSRSFSLFLNIFSLSLPPVEGRGGNSQQKRGNFIFLRIKKPTLSLSLREGGEGRTKLGRPKRK